MKQKLLLVGPVPPPAGGVSIHLTRLRHLLGNEFNVKILDESRIKKDGIPSIRRFKVGEYFKLLYTSDIIHIHSGTRFLKYAHVLFSKLLGRSTVLTIHSYTVKPSWILRKVDEWVYSLPHVTILVGDEINKNLELKTRVVVKEAFLPPIMEVEPPVPQNILSWIETKRAAGFKVGASNAYRLRTLDGQDVYGLDMCIDAVALLRDQGKKVAFVYVVSDLNGDRDVADDEKRIADKGLEDIFFLHKSPVSFVNLIRDTDFIVRATNTDGDALTVREGLFFGKPTIVSNVVKRPAGALLFPTRDTGAMAKLIGEVVERHSLQISQQAAREDFIRFYREIYNSLGEHHKHAVTC